LPALYSYDAFLTDGQVWEDSLRFSFPDAFVEGDTVMVRWISINGALFAVDKEAIWDGENSGHFMQLFAELWRYNVTSGSLGFDNRFATLWLNVTQSF
jgi:hypothetical protein